MVHVTFELGCQEQYNWRGEQDLQSICYVAAAGAILGTAARHTTPCNDSMVVAAATSNGPPADQTLRDTARVMQAVQGHWLSACLGVLMKLKIPEILASAGEETMSFFEVRSTVASAAHVSCGPPHACESLPHHSYVRSVRHVSGPCR